MQASSFMHLSIEFNFDPGIPQQASSHLVLRRERKFLVVQTIRHLA